MRHSTLKRLSCLLAGLLAVTLLPGAVPGSAPIYGQSENYGETGPASGTSQSATPETTESSAEETSAETLPSLSDTTAGSISEATGTTSSSSSGQTSSGSTTQGAQSKPAAGATTTQTQETRPPVSVPSGKISAGYYGGWGAYTGYTPDKIPADKLTHLFYAFAKIDPSSLTIALSDPAKDRQNFAAFSKLKKKHPRLQTLISVGGWDYSGYFSDAAATAASRQAFAKSCAAFLREHGFDGIDLDWEYPVSGGLAGNHNRPADKQNFTLLLRAIREELDRAGAQDGKRYLLTIAGAADTSYLKKIEPAKVADLVDHIFLMAYDLHGPWDKYADLTAPLYTPSADSPQYKGSVDSAVTAYLNAGVPAKKLVLGMPLYGYRYTGVGEANNGLYSPFSSAASISYTQVVSGYLDQPGYTRWVHPEAKVPVISGNGVFISYEDAQSVAAKAALARERGLGGVGFWELSHDRGGSLVSSAVRALG